MKTRPVSGFVAALLVAVFLTLAAAPAGRASEMVAEKDGWIALFNGKDLSGWKLKRAGGPNGWTVSDGIYVNTPRSTDILTERQFTDFHLHVEFMIPKGSNSGVYLRGRHEIQIFDSFGKEVLRPVDCGSIYGRSVPAANASKRPGQWQTFDVTLVGGRLTVFHNGVCIHNHLDLGTAAKSGPILLQGDHGKVSYRNLRIKPLGRDYVAQARVYVLSSHADDLYVISVPEHEVVGKITVGRYPHGIEANAAQTRLYVSAEADDLVNVIDLATDKVLKRIPVGPDPNEIAVTPDGRLLYVPSGTTGFYEVVDVAAGEIVAKIKTGGNPHNVVCSPDGKYMYLSPLGDPHRIFIVETATHQVVREIPLGGQARPIAIRGDGRRLYVEYDPLIGFVLAQIPEGKILHTPNIELPPDVKQQSRSHGIGVTPDGKEVWVCDVVHELVAVFDVTAEPPRQITLIPTKDQPYWLTFSPDGKFCYVSNTKSNVVQVVDVATHKTIKWVTVGDSPKRILAITAPQF